MQGSDWLSPDLDWSQLPNPKDPSTKISFRDWKALTDSRSTLMSGAVCDVFSHWATDRDHSALWTLGLQVKVPDTAGLSELRKETLHMLTFGLDETNLATYREWPLVVAVVVTLSTEKAFTNLHQSHLRCDCRTIHMLVLMRNTRNLKHQAQQFCTEETTTAWSFVK